jgi:hypothetical protein
MGPSGAADRRAGELTTMRWSPLPVLHMLGSRLRRHARELESAAVRTWQIAPSYVQFAPRAFFLPNQLERITGWAFCDGHPGREMEGDRRVEHAPTRGVLLENAWLLDGVLYKGGACSHLKRRSRRFPRLVAEREIGRAAVMCTAGGNQYFGTWLMDDCPRYALAMAEGEPVTTDQPPSDHMRQYESWLEMKPTRTGAAFLHEAVIFSDAGQNRDKHRRSRAITDKLRARVDTTPHPGVFVVRGAHGQRRLLRNETELAERMRDRHGFRILDPMHSDVPTIVAACAGARIAIGIEGSALVHAVQVLEPGAGVLTLQPPMRFCPLLKHVTDRDDQHFAFVVGKVEGEDFRIDPEELDRTLDLFPASLR